MRPLSSAARIVRSAKSPFTQVSFRAKVVLSFLALYLIAIQVCRVTFNRDPTSWFFDTSVGYAENYSAVRRQQADAFIDAAATNVSHRTSDASRPQMCVGIATVARDQARYFRTSVGSLLEGLTPEERQGIYLILMIAHTEPTEHPAYSEKWLHNVADRVLMYNMPEDELDHIRQLELDRGLFREKALFDYTYLLKACATVGAPYVTMVEDDVIALDGWYHRTNKALESAEAQTHERGVSEFLYLRLFYTEELLGWNSEEWPTYFVWSLVAATVPVIAWLALRHFVPSLKRTMSVSTLLLGCGVVGPLLILLFFSVGRASTGPLPPGVNEMSNFGCCSQSFVFPQTKALQLVDYYESKKIGFVDMLTEELADKNNELRWALTPSVMQHVGRKSSKGDSFGSGASTPKHNMTDAEKLWNFAFERNDPKVLHEEHLREAKAAGG